MSVERKINPEKKKKHERTVTKEEIRKVVCKEIEKSQNHESLNIFSRK